MKPAGNPWMKFYPSDWRADAMLRLCSIGARGLWAEMMCLMHDAVPYGSLLVNGRRIDKKQLAGLAAISERECTALLIELEANGVFSRDDDGTIYSRRMRRDAAKAVKDKENGKLGGNPSVKAGVNPPVNGGVKAQKPEARDQKDSEATASGAEAPPDPAIPEREYFERGREVLGSKAGAMIANLLKAKGGNVALARAAVEQASQKQSPTEYVAAICRGPPISAKPLTEFQRKQQETNDVRAQLRNLANGGGSGGSSDRFLPADHGERSEGLRGGPGSVVLAIPGAPGRGGG